jgi:hypothetical protein
MTTAHDDPFLQAMNEVFPVEQPRAFTVVPSVPPEQRDEAWQGRARAWTQKALQGRCERLAQTPADTDRNEYLNKSAWVLYRYALAGHLDAEQVTEQLRYAAVESQLGTGEVEATLASAHRGAMKPENGPLDPPVDGGADPFDGVLVDPVTGEVKEPLTPEQAAQRRHEQAVAHELAQLRARDEAKMLYAAEKAEREWREPPSTRTLVEELLIPDEPVQYAIAGLLPVGANALLTAQYKTGKTTFIDNLARCFADGEPFLERYRIDTAGGRIALFNYELDASMNRRWLREMQIRNPERVVVLNLRGFRLPLTASSVEDWVVRWLEEREVTMWVVDPFARASVGDITDESKNSEVGVWLDTLDVIKQRAGVRDLVLPTHTGRVEMEAGQERARGATRLDDWADVRWFLTKDDADVRYFRATGRDVEVAEEKLAFDEERRALRIGGGDRLWEARRRLEECVVQYVLSNPGCTQAAIEEAVSGKADRVRAAVRAAVAGHRLRVEDGPKNSHLHYVNV